MRVVMVVEPVVEIPKVSHGEGFGMRVLERAAILDPRDDTHGHAYTDQFQTEDDLRKIWKPKVRLDEKAMAIRLDSSLTRFFNTSRHRHCILRRLIEGDGDACEDHAAATRMSFSCSNEQWEVWDACWELPGANILSGTAVAGDKRSHPEFGKTGLSAFELIVVPGLSMLDEQGQRGLDSRALCGSVVKWTGTKELAFRFEILASQKSREDVWLLARKILGRPAAAIAVNLLGQD